MEWIEQTADFFAWVVPISAILGLWFARLTEDAVLRCFAQRLYFALLLLVSGATLRTILCDDSCWLLHTFSLGAMTVGAILPAIFEVDCNPETEIAEG